MYIICKFNEDKMALTRSMAKNLGAIFVERLHMFLFSRVNKRSRRDSDDDYDNEEYGNGKRNRITMDESLMDTSF